MRTLRTAGARFLSNGFARSSQKLETVDHTRAAQQVADYIVGASPRTEEEAKDPEKVKCSIAAGPDMSYSLALAMQRYIANSSGKNGWRSRLANYDLTFGSIADLESLGEKKYKNLAVYLDAAFKAVVDSDTCMDRAGKIIGINYQATARIIIMNHMISLKGL